jgi:pilus assembly protein CpaF
MRVDLRERVRTRLVAASQEATVTNVASALRAEGVVLGDDALRDAVHSLNDHMHGAGPVQVLLNDPVVTDVLINGATEVWCDRGAGLERTELRFSSEQEVRRLAQRLAASVGRRIDEAAPFVDARLPDGSRLHCIIPPISVGGTTISLRTSRTRPFTVDELINAGTLSQGAADLLREMIDAQLAFLISGSTGSGKTTLLNSLLGLVSPRHRIVIIEDSSELDPAHPHVVRLQSRPANAEGMGAIALRDLVRQSLRMRPDRVVVGEVRGVEVVELLTALNTGHEGGCGTVHANSAADVPARLEALGLMAGLDRQALHALAGAGLDAIVHLGRGAGNTRQVQSVHVCQRAAGGEFIALPAWTLEGGVWTEKGSARALSDLIDARRNPRA